MANIQPTPSSSQISSPTPEAKATATPVEQLRLPPRDLVLDDPRVKAARDSQPEDSHERFNARLTGHVCFYMAEDLKEGISRDMKGLNQIDDYLKVNAKRVIQLLDGKAQPQRYYSLDDPAISNDRFYNPISKDLLKINEQVKDWMNDTYTKNYSQQEQFNRLNGLLEFLGQQKEQNDAKINKGNTYQMNLDRAIDKGRELVGNGEFSEAQKFLNEIRKNIEGFKISPSGYIGKALESVKKESVKTQPQQGFYLDKILKE
ncbi:MAG: hypothetical protein IT292_12240 [Deltaproteobacteria bacterium]|nr:hypothetical protein [Deltaproteobacteria bacterium]